MEELPTTRYRIAPKARLVFDRARGKHMLIYPERGLSLNDVAHAILSLCDGGHSVAQVVDALSLRFSSDREIIARDVTAFIDQLAARGLLLSEE
jgi:coenzyme PQQ biosynthesis protein PqqD